MRLINRKFFAIFVMAVLVVGNNAHSVNAGSDFEAESATSGITGWTKIVNDSNASGGKAVKFHANGAISKRVTTLQATRLNVTARANLCQGAPTMTVKLDGATVMNNQLVSSTSYISYSQPLINVGAGSHRIDISYTNDFYSSPSCDRNLMVDKVELASPSTQVEKAQTKPATASCVQSKTSHVAVSANDGSATTRWSSCFENSQWWQVDLGEATSVSKVDVNWETAYASRYIIQGSRDGINFTTLSDVTNSNSGLKSTSFSAANARYIRIFGLTRATSWGFSIWDVKVYGDAGSPATAIDNVSPNVSLVGITEAQIVKGNIPVQANAIDNVGVTRVEFYIDDNSTTPVKTDTTAPYCLADDNGTTCNGWDSTKASEGTHRLTAKAVDAANNTAITPTVSFTVSNTTPPAPLMVSAVDDPSASAGKAMKFNSNGRAKKTVAAPAVSLVSVTARGDQCNGAPQMTVKINGNPVITAAVSSTTYTKYSAPINLTAGSYQIAIEYSNDASQAGVCDRNLIVDKVEFTPTPVNSGGGSTAKVWRIVPVGDSITEQSSQKGIYAGTIKTQLASANIQSSFLSYVNSSEVEASKGPRIGRGGWCTTDANNVCQTSEPTWTGAQGILEQIDGWVSQTQPDIVLLNAGTNDQWASFKGDRSEAAIATRLGQIMDKVYAKYPNAAIFITGLKEKTNDYPNLNSLIKQQVQTRSAAGRKAFYTDAYAGFVSSTDFVADGVHPSDTGFAKMATNWLNSIKPYIQSQSGGTTSGGTTGGGTTTPPPPPVANGTLRSLLQYDMAGANGPTTMSEAMPNGFTGNWSYRPQYRSTLAWATGDAVCTGYKNVLDSTGKVTKVPYSVACTHVMPWGTLYQQSGGNNTNAKVQIADMQAWAQYSNGQWYQIQSFPGVPSGAQGELFPQNWLCNGTVTPGGCSTHGVTTTLADKSTTVYLPQTVNSRSDYLYHFWAGNRFDLRTGPQPISKLTRVVTFVRARIDPATYDPNAKYVICIGMDRWGPNNENGWEQALGRFKKVDANWRVYSGSSSPIGPNDTLPSALTGVLSNSEYR